MSKRTTLASRYADAFFITNLTLFSQKLAKGVEVSGSVYNLFDEEYSDPASGEHVQDTIEQDGVNFRFKVTYLFDI
jgi:outer membrane receptor for ferrienterochelin and colicins